MDERRVASTKQRKSRITVGGVATPMSVVVAIVFHEIVGKDMSPELTVAVSSLIGSLTGVVSICFWDIRGILLARARRRRLDASAPP